MRITKFGHACVRLEHEGKVVVVDPGMFTDPEAVDGADAVVISHEHPDHYLPDHLAGTDAPVFTIAAVAAKIRDDAPAVAERVTVVAPGESFDPGIPAESVGELHAVIHPEIPRIQNIGFLVEGQVFHPGDALTVPDEPVTTLLLPIHAPWSKASEIIDYVREVRADQAYALHDGLLNDTGLGLFTGLLGERGPGTPTPYSRLAPGDSVDL